MSAVNAIIATVLKGALSPFQNMSPLIGLALVAVATAVVTLLIVKATTNQMRMAAVKRSIYACILEARLLSDDPRAVTRALGELLRHNLTYARLSLVPLLVMVLPFGLLIAHLDASYGVGELSPGRAVLVKVKVTDPSGPAPQLTAPPDVRIETPGVSIPSLRETTWRVSAVRADEYELTVLMGGTAVTKQLTTTPGAVPRSVMRPETRVFDQLRYPAERPIPAGSGIESITVTYPTRGILIFGWEVHWLVVFFGLSMAFAFALRSALKVVI